MNALRFPQERHHCTHAELARIACIDAVYDSRDEVLGFAAALVESLTDDETVVTLVNTNPVSARAVTVQGGAYAEHQILSVQIGDAPAKAIDASAFSLSLAPGAGATLTLKMKRHANPRAAREPPVKCAE